MAELVAKIDSTDNSTKMFRNFFSSVWQNCSFIKLVVSVKVICVILQASVWETYQEQEQELKYIQKPHPKHTFVLIR